MAGQDAANTDDDDAAGHATAGHGTLHAAETPLRSRPVDSGCGSMMRRSGSCDVEKMLMKAERVPCI